MKNGFFHSGFAGAIRVELAGSMPFLLHGGIGLRWMINNHWAFSVEGDYRHISNADLASRNSGLDSLGGLLGLNFLF